MPTLETPRRLTYISQGNIPSRWAHSIQSGRMAQAFAQIGLDVELLIQGSTSEQVLLPLRRRVGRVLDGDRALPAESPSASQDWHGGSLRIRRLRTSLRSRRDAQGFFSATEGSYSAFFRAAAAYCGNNRPDLVFTRSFQTALSTIDAGLPTIIETHDAPHLSDKQRANIQALAKFKDNAAFKGMVTISAVLQEEFAEQGIPRERILVWPDAVDLQPYVEANKFKSAQRSPDAPLRVGYCGQLYEWKGVGVLIEAARACPQMNFEIIGGNAPDIQKWKDKAQGLSNVRFRGYIPNDQVPRALQDFDVVCLPNSARCEDREWMSPLKMYEYMGAAQAIVASDLPAIRRVLRHEETALLFEPDSPQALAGALRCLQDQEPLRQKLCANAFQFVQQYTWQKRAQDIIDWIGK